MKANGWEPIEFVQQAGEVVFVPSFWYHAIRNIEPSVGISGRVGVPPDFESRSLVDKGPAEAIVSSCS